MKTQSILLLLAVCSCLGTSRNLFAETTGVDSVYNLLKGLWYLEFRVDGYTGRKITVNKSDSVIFQRIPDTDSITLKDYYNGLVKRSEIYQLTFDLSGNLNKNVWMLKYSDCRYLLNFTNNALWMSLDYNDGGQNYYIRTPLATGITNSTHANGKMVLTQQPTTSHFSVSGLPFIDRLEISDLYGRIQRQTDRVDVGESIDMSTLSAGIYLVKVYSGKESYSGKIIRK